MIVLGGLRLATVIKEALGSWTAEQVQEKGEPRWDARSLPHWEENAAPAATCSQTLLASRSVRAGREGKGVGDTKVHFRKPSGR